ncbi:FlaA1/EpsC-like NDP-sugar epimerase [Desulfitispora alkaliphila]|uniref:polysaccharide biosynthesis protein n=1 Tax=Desulfitispora alkaliphila TaxID=622674 RepID=UPI003D1EFC18
MERYTRIGALMVIDAILINIALYASLVIRFDGPGQIPEKFIEALYTFAPLFTLVFLTCFYFFGLYNRVWRYASIGELLSVMGAITMGVTISISIAYFFMPAGEVLLPRSAYILTWMLCILLVGGSRLSWRLFRDYGINYNKPKGGKPVLIVGAGSSGVLVAKEMMRHYESAVNIVGFVDDDPQKKGLQILGIKVLGDRSHIKELVTQFCIQEIVLAIPSAEGKVVREIIDICHETEAEIKILPGMYDLIEGNVKVSEIREVQLEDLLGRDPVKVDLEGISQYVQGQVVLVTGAGGSIGSELCRQLANFTPKRLLMLDNCENNLYSIEMELRNDPHLKIYPLVKDIRDKSAIEQVFKIHKPEVVFHAAAHKHVPLMEANPEEAIKNNVMGTHNVAQAADTFGASKFVLISTDKAVNPTSVMGASKRVAEMFIQQLDKTSETNFVAVRFGNVLGSKGSVIPLFKKQISQGGPVTVTHEKMVRYFMTIPEAVQLVIQAGAMARGGEVFVLDMGDPVKIMDLAKSLIKLSGFEPGEDIEIVVTGMRPGEKLYEELLTAEEGVNATTHKRIFVAKPNELDRELIEETIFGFHKGVLPKSQSETEAFLKQFIPEYKVVENKMTG